MSNKENVAQQILQEWQKQMQGYLSDPKVAENMVEYYAKFQESIEKFNKDFSSNNSSTTSNNDDARVILKLENRVDELESRIKLLEKFMATSLK